MVAKFQGDAREMWNYSEEHLVEKKSDEVEKEKKTN